MTLALFFALVTLAAPGPLELREEHADGVYTIDGSFSVDGESSGLTTWAVLTDYDHLGDFLSSVRESRVEHRQPGSVTLEQEVVGKALFISRTLHLVLEITEGPGHQLAFHDTSHRDFVEYDGSYALVERAGAVRLVYHLRAQPRVDLPGFVGGSVFKSNANDLLHELQVEINRRSRLSPSGP